MAGATFYVGKTAAKYTVRAPLQLAKHKLRAPFWCFPLVTACCRFARRYIASPPRILYKPSHASLAPTVFLDFLGLASSRRLVGVPPIVIALIVCFRFVDVGRRRSVGAPNSLNDQKDAA